MSHLLKLKIGVGTYVKGSVVEAGRVTYTDGTFDYIVHGGNWLVSPRDCEVLSVNMSLEQYEAGLLAALWHKRWETGEACPMCWTAAQWREICWQKFKHFQLVEAGEVGPAQVDADTMQALTGQEWSPEAMEQFQECCGGEA